MKEKRKKGVKSANTTMKTEVNDDDEQQIEHQRDKVTVVLNMDKKIKIGNFTQYT